MFKALLPLIALPLCTTAFGATFDVDTTNDTADDDPNDGFCLDSSGDCSLRAAVEQANASAGADTIQLSNEHYTVLSSMSITDDLTVVGILKNTTIVDAAGNDRVFDIPGTTATSVRLEKMTIQGGSANYGGGIRVRGSANLDLVRVRLYDNYVIASGAGVHFHADTLYIYRSDIEENVAEGSGGGIFVSGTLQMGQTTVANNVALSGGGGMYVFAYDASSWIRRSTLSGNTAVNNGGGIVATGTYLVPWEIRNTTISGNYAFGEGGGISSSNTDLTLLNTTTDGNWALSGVGMDLNINSGATVYVGDSFIGHSGRPSSTCDGTLNSLGHNIIVDGPSCTIVGGVNDLLLAPNQYAHLEDLAENGGWTSTHALTQGSAVDGADPTRCLGSDQRGEPRPAGACDIGAFEMQ